MSVLVCSPERFGLPAVPSDRRRCDRCYATVWLSKRAELEAEGITGILCIVCAMAVIKVGDEIEPAPWVLEDIAEAEESAP